MIADIESETGFGTTGKMFASEQRTRARYYGACGKDERWISSAAINAYEPKKSSRNSTLVANGRALAYGPSLYRQCTWLCGGPG